MKLDLLKLKVHYFSLQAMSVYIFFIVGFALSFYICFQGTNVSDYHWRFQGGAPRVKSIDKYKMHFLLLSEVSYVYIWFTMAGNGLIYLQSLKKELLQDITLALLIS